MKTPRSTEMIRAAYFMAKFGEPGDSGKYNPPHEMGVTSWTEAYEQLYPQLGDGRSFETFRNSIDNDRGFFIEFPAGRETDRPRRRQIIRECENLSRAKLWAKVRQYIEPAPALACDLDVPPDRVEITVSRIIRDTKLSTSVKRIHDFCCQICGETIRLTDGTGYAEGHHLQPLGEPHGGPDVGENIICLCPNHHAACDLGAIRLELDQLRSAPGHRVGKRFVEYHNDVIFDG